MCTQKQCRITSSRKTERPFDQNLPSIRARHPIVPAPSRIPPYAQVLFARSARTYEANEANRRESPLCMSSGITGPASANFGGGSLSVSASRSTLPVFAYRSRAQSQSSYTALRASTANRREPPLRISPYDIRWPARGRVGGRSLSGSSYRRFALPAPVHRSCAESPYSETALREFTVSPGSLPSVEILREIYGKRPNFWGDLTAAETRRFYHELLPVSIRHAVDAKVSFDSHGRPRGEVDDVSSLTLVVDKSAQKWQHVIDAAETLEDLARLASEWRTAAKLYARERCHFPMRLVAHFYDGFRHLRTHGSFRWGFSVIGGFGSKEITRGRSV